MQKDDIDYTIPSYGSQSESPIREELGWAEHYLQAGGQGERPLQAGGSDVVEVERASVP